MFCFLGVFFCHFSRSWRLFIPSTPSPSSLPLWQNPCSLSDVRLIRWVWSSLSVDLKTICLFSPSPFLLLLLHLLLGWELTVTKTHSSSRRMAQGVPRFFHDIRLLCEWALRVRLLFSSLPTDVLNSLVNQFLCKKKKQLAKNPEMCSCKRWQLKTKTRRLLEMAAADKNREVFLAHLLLI